MVLYYSKCKSVVGIIALGLLLHSSALAGYVTADPPADDQGNIYVAVEGTITFTAGNSGDNNISIVGCSFPNLSGTPSLGGMVVAATFTDDATDKVNSGTVSVSSSSSDPNGGSCSSYTPIAFNAIVPAIQIYHANMDGYKKIDGTNKQIIIGEQVSFQVDIPGPAPAGDPTYHWSPPSDAIDNYNMGQVTPVDEGDKTEDSITYYHTAASSTSVLCSVTIPGNNPVTQTISGRYTVVSPTNVAFTSSATPVALNLQAGKLTCSNTFTQAAALPNGFSGDFVWAQVLDHVVVTENGVTVQASNNALDDSFPYDSGLTTNDNPYAPLTNSPVREDFSASMYLMFIPSLPNSIYVPLSVLSWSWGGTATLDPASKKPDSWLLSNDYPPTSRDTAHSTTNEPTWTSVYNSH